MKQVKKAVIFAPFWRQPNHVGNYRIDRFVRWLAEDGFYVVLVRAGSVAGQSDQSWGIEITVRDPLGLYRDTTTDGSPVKLRKPNQLRRQLAYWLFNPDPGIRWARVAARDSDVLELAKGALFVISSSPPESAHIGAAILAKKLKSKLIIDMRDGWLDEPLKPLLRKSRLRRWLESRLEKSVLRQAGQIFVTSPVWKTLLTGRLPFTEDKTTVLTNACPPVGLFDLKKTRKRTVNEPVRLVHAGRFTGSRLSQKVGYLLEPLLLGIGECETQGVVTLLGHLEARDLSEIKKWQPQFKSKGWTIEVKDAVPRDEMMDILRQADGLLLLSASEAAIPSKLFEYLILEKPILTATPQSSAVWQVGKSLNQLFLTDYRNPELPVARSYISTCVKTANDYEIPDQFSEEVLSKVFITKVLVV